MKKRITTYALLGLACLLSGMLQAQGGIGQVTYDVTWENLSKATFTYPTLQRASSVSGTGKATSENMLFGSNPANFRFINGFMSYIPNTTNQTKKIGFSVTASKNTEITNTIDYGFAFQSNGKVKAFTADESSAAVSYSQIDELIIDRRNGEMIFKVSGTELLRVNADPTETLMLRAELTSNNSSFSDVRVSFATSRLIVDPVIDNVNNSILMEISGGLSPFEYYWEDGMVRQYPTLFHFEKYFNKGLHQVTITDRDDNQFERSFLQGNDMNWANLVNTQQSGKILSKTTATGWGSALSAATIGGNDYFWVQYLADVQPVSKAVGVAYTTTTFSQYTNLEAGFMLLAENQLQVIYQGAVVFTTEYANRDALLIANDAKGLRWLINGKEVYARTAAFTGDLKVGGLLKDNASLNGVSYFNINHKPLLSSWSAENLNGSVSLNIASLTSGNSPYHYYISETPIPSLHEMYVFARDSIFGDTLGGLDSLAFFEGSHLPTSTTHVFEGLESGEYFVAAFDKTGLLLFSDKVNLYPPLSVYNSNGITLNTNLLTATQNNATADLSYYIDESLPESRIDFTILNASEKYSLGLSDFNATTTAIQYGFFVNAKTVKFYVNGTLQNTKYSVKNNNILSLEKSGSTLYYKINDVAVHQTTLSGTYLLKTQLEIAKGGTTVKVQPKKPMIKLYKFTAVTDNATCEDSQTALSFTLTKKPNQNGVFFDYTLTSLTGSEVYTGSVASGSAIPVMNNIPLGLYRLTGSTNTLPSTQVSEIVEVGIQGKFQPVVDYSLSPNSYSLSRTSLAHDWAAALSANVLKADQAGWISFEALMPSMGGTQSYLSFNTDYSLAVPTEGTYVKINWTYLPDLNPNGLGSLEYRFYENNTLMAIRNYAPGARVSAIIEGNAILFLTNGIETGVTLVRPGGDLNIKALSKQLGEGFKDVLFSFTCGQLQFNYPKLTRKLKGEKYKTHNNHVYFSYDEEYAVLGENLKFKVYNVENNLVNYLGNNTLSKEHGNNLYKLNVSTLSAGVYVLEVQNKKEEIFYLRFVKN